MSTPPASAEETAAQERARFWLRSTPVQTVQIAGVSAAERASLLARSARVHPGRRLTGVGQVLENAIVQRGRWMPTNTGERIWRLQIRSQGASSVRLHFEDFDAGKGELWVVSGDGTDLAGPYTGTGPLAHGEFWSMPVFADVADVLYRPEGMEEALPFRLTGLMHGIGEDTLEPAAGPAAVAGVNAAGDPASCNVDASCYQETIYKQARQGVAQFVYVDPADGHGHDCTGAVVNNVPGEAIPYFLTANHCISSQAAADTMVVYFNYETAACNGPTPDKQKMPKIEVATYLASAPFAGGDYSLVRLSGLPSGITVRRLGWTLTIR
jgi:hypothetical protein